MAIQTTPHTQEHGEPAQADFDQNEISDEVGKGYDGEEFQEQKEAQSAGSRNERVANYGGNEHNVEPTTVEEYQQNQPKASADAVGITNHSLSEENKQQERVPGARPDAVGPVDPKE